MFYQHLGASSLAVRFSMWFGAHPIAAMSGLCDVGSQRWRLISVDVMVVELHYTFYKHSGRVVPGDTVFNVVWCTPTSGDVATSRCGLSTVAPLDANFARCS